MQDGDADLALLVNVGMPDLCEDAELWRLERILLGEMQVALEEAALVQCVRRSDYHHLEST